MIIRNTFKAAALTSVCLLPLMAVAQAADDTGFDLPEAMPNTQELNRISSQPAEYDNSVSVGLRGQSSTSAEYGRYNGNYREGGSVIGDFRFSGRSDWKSTDTYYYNLNGSDLKLGFGGSFDIAPNSSISLKVGNQGTWGLTANYDAMTYVASNNFNATYNSNGTLSPGIAAGAYVAGQSGQTQSLLIGTRRDKGSVEGKYYYGDLLFTSGVTHEHKEGTQEGYISFLTQATFVMPINYDTDRFTASVAFNTPKLQSSLNYTFSKFTDNNTAVNFVNFKTTTNGAIYVLPPSNMAHQVSGQVGYNLNDDTRLNINTVYGLQLQNDDFQLATHDNAVTPPLPSQGSLNGFVQTLFGNVALTTRPLPKTDLRLAYTIDTRSNNTNTLNPVDGLRSDAGSASKIMYRTPLNESWVKQTAQVTAGYRILPSTKLTLGYTWRDTERSDALIKSSSENEVAAKVRTTFSDETTGSVGYTHAIRAASAPNFAIWNQLVSGGGDCGQSASGNIVDCAQVPYYQAARTQDAVKARLNQVLGADASAGLVMNAVHDRYPNVSYGRTSDYKIMSGPDLNYRFSPDAEAHAFYTYERTFSSFNDNSIANPAANPSYNWKEYSTSDTHTVGLGGSIKPISNLKIGADYNLSYGMMDFAESGNFLGTAVNSLASAQLPTVTSMLNSFKLHGEYEYVPGVTLYLGYGYDRLTSNDWALVGTVSQAYTSGQSNPSYAVHSVVSKVSFKW